METTSPAKAPSRVPIWEYLKSISVELKVEQHEALKKLIVEYADARAEMFKARFDEMVAASIKRKAANRARFEAMQAKRKEKYAAKKMPSK